MLLAQPQLEQEMEDVQAGLTNWVPYIGIAEDDGIRLDYNGDGDREIIGWYQTGDNLFLSARSSTETAMQWVFEISEEWQQPDWQPKDLIFLGFQDIDADGELEALIAKRNRPFRELGLTHVAVVTENGDYFNFGADRVLKDIADWDGDGNVELVFQNVANGKLELWGQ
jgi:hypothetical protein